MTEVTFHRRAAVESILGSDDFAPSPAQPSLTPGPTADLRAEMARFSAGVDHSPRRAAVESAIAGLDTFPFEAEARRRTDDRLDGTGLDALADLGFVIPTETLGTALGVTSDHLAALVGDVRAIAEVIGRQLANIAASDDAVSRLRRQFNNHPSGSVAPISLLYQNHDATAALLSLTILAQHEGGQRRSAVAGTSRIALRNTGVVGIDVSAGEVVALDLESTDLEFGAGPHQCPGRPIAERIVTGIAASIEASVYTLDSDRLTFHPDGRPSSLPLKQMTNPTPTQ